MTVQVEQPGFHIIIEGYGAPRQLLSNCVYLYTVLEDLPQVIGMGAVTEPQLIESGAFSAASPGSLSGFVMNAESHFSFHAVPARGYVTIDFYTRQDGINRQSVIGLLASSFALKDAGVSVQNCGSLASAQLMAA
jgi:S-adenosylmethionine/arginine decarboxylase-like enzyme